ncbi:MAG: DUF2911 domain-containing protein [Bacteroidota bacterium]
MKLLFQILIFLFSTSVGLAQSFEIPTTNSRSSIKQRIASTDIEVTYNRPNMKGRTIFGSLIPYGQVWRTGSDASTKVHFSTSVFIGDTELDSGTYELFTIPGEDEWIIIFQENRSQWGSYSYNNEHDLLRLIVAPSKLPEPVETFTMGFDNVTSNTAILSLSWENIKVPIPVSVDLTKTVVPQLELALLQEGRKPYFRAAMFYYENDLNIQRASELMTMAIQENPKHIGMLYRQALILENLGDKKGAIVAAEKSLNEAMKVSGELKAEYIRLNGEILSRLKR